MNLSVAFFGITREIVGHSTLTVTLSAEPSVADLLTQLRSRYPALAELRSLAVAVNNDYAAPHDRLRPHDEVALIPPVSGG